MNLENIQERLSDIQNLRSISQQNENTVSQIHTKTSHETKLNKTQETETSTLKIRFLIAFCLFGVFLWADTEKTKSYQQTIQQVEKTISYDLTLEDIKNICYTEKVQNIIETIQSILPSNAEKIQMEEEK